MVDADTDAWRTLVILSFGGLDLNLWLLAQDAFANLADVFEHL